jgi:hypothetical protein
MTTAIKDIVIPSKWDIIPIHTSDRETFKRCRRQWDWSSPARRNLIRRVSQHGVILPLWFGTGIHYALQKYYNPVLKEDPEKVFTAWFDTEWNGGLIHYGELDYYADREPQPDSTSDRVKDEVTGLEVPSRYFVKGLRQLLPEYDEEIFAEHRALGIGMMRFYKEYAARNDNFRVVATESTFSVPVRDEDGIILRMRDDRKMPEWWDEQYAKGSGYWPEKKEVHARGRRDTIIQDLETGMYGIIDHKTTSKLDEDYFRHLELDEQCTTYMWASEQEAEMYDLEYKKIDFIIYNALRKAFPKPPTVTSRGMPSLDRQKESTTPQMFEECVKGLGLELVLQTDPKMRAYYEYLLEAGDKQFVMRGTPEMHYVTRNKAQKENAGRRLYAEAMDMLSNPRIYPNPRKDYSCLNCVFRAPCIMAERGEDYEFVLETSFHENYDR